jgi:hypothetical protein
MKLRQASLQEVLQLAAQKIYNKGGGKETVVYLPPFILPPTKRAYRWETFESEYGQVKMFSTPHREGGWLVRVKFSQPIQFNPALTPAQGKEILEKLNKK